MAAVRLWYVWQNPESGNSWLPTADEICVGQCSYRLPSDASPLRETRGPSTKVARLMIVLQEKSGSLYP